MIIIQYIKEVLSMSLNSIFSMAIMIIPLMIIMEILKDLKILDIISNKCKPVSKVLNMSEDSIFPLMIGLILGLSYGAGVIIDSSSQGKLSKQDLYLLMIFLVACHSIFEDTLLFASIGANGYLLLCIRFVIAFLLTYFVGKVIGKRSKAAK
ncbi:nucleoside recognition domain-containing protein [Clostridiaceae bacterium M8S5]|nr:nucleoside recognition domain-containing protein [Clostridiaceae bacterium M8S5]